MADFAAKLRLLMKNAEPSLEVFRGGIIEMGEAIRIYLRKGKRADQDQFFKKLSYFAKVVDAVDFLERQFGKGASGKVVNIPVPKGSADEAKCYLREVFEHGRAPDRGFVYVVWRQKPQRFLYVGKAGSASRLTLLHTDLAHAIPKASTISLLYPAKSLDQTLLGIEASLLQVIAYSTGGWAENNTKEERVPSGQSTALAGEIADYLDGYVKGLRRI